MSSSACPRTRRDLSILPRAVTPRTISVLLADDHAVVRHGLRELLERAPGIRVVGGAATGEEALALAEAHRPDVLILDLKMPGPGGAAVVERLKECSPTTRTLVLSMHDTVRHVMRLMEAGAHGYALKASTVDALPEAVRAVADGRAWIDPRMAGDVLGPGRAGDASEAPSVPELSPREKTVLRMVAWGYENREIAGELGISPRTVETYRARIGEKTGLRRRTELVRYALARGWMAEEP